VFKLKERPAFEKGRNVPSEHKAFERMAKSDEELEELAQGTRSWIQNSMKEDAKK
jgi:glutathione S-transferase